MALTSHIVNRNIINVRKFHMRLIQVVVYNIEAIFGIVMLALLASGYFIPHIEYIFGGVSMVILAVIVRYASGTEEVRLTYVMSTYMIATVLLLSTYYIFQIDGFPYALGSSLFLISSVLVLSTEGFTIVLDKILSHFDRKYKTMCVHTETYNPNIHLLYATCYRRHRYSNFKSYEQTNDCLLTICNSNVVASTGFESQDHFIKWFTSDTVEIPCCSICEITEKTDGNKLQSMGVSCTSNNVPHINVCSSCQSSLLDEIKSEQIYQSEELVLRCL